MKIDSRLISVGIEVNGVLRTYTGLNIKAVGTKYANALQNDCEITLSNLTTETRDFILTETSPYNSNSSPKRISLYAGRVSTGQALIFDGNITSSHVTQPPDISIVLKCLTLNYQKGNIISRNQPQSTSLSTIAKQIASDLGVPLNFQATNKQVSNYNFTGAALKQVDKLEDSGEVDAYLDNGFLVVKNTKVALTNKVRVLNINTGMIGVPELTETGIRVVFFIDNQTVLGGAVQVKSILNPAVNGIYAIYKLGFDIASRDTPFYWIADAVPQPEATV